MITGLLAWVQDHEQYAKETQQLLEPQVAWGVIILQGVWATPSL